MSNRVMLKQIVSVTLIAALHGAGCGDDEEVAASAGQGGATGATGGQGGDSGGTGGTGVGDSGGSGGSQSGGAGGMSGGSGPITCGSKSCSSITAPEGSVLIACCVPDTSACGVIADAIAMKCVEVGQTGVPSGQCPGELNVLQVETPGCCQPDGDCGLSSGVLMGCVERTEYPATFLASGAAVTDARPCTPGAAEDDAGM